jgi:hypothetical protein
MEQMIGALRGHVRQAVSRLSPRLRQLVASMPRWSRCSRRANSNCCPRRPPC